MYGNYELLQEEDEEIEVLEENGDFYISSKGASITLEALEMSCSFLCLTDISVGEGQELSLIKLLHKTFQLAYTPECMGGGDYTKIFCTMNNTYQGKKLRSVLEAIGFVPVSNEYRNRRTKKLIQWYQGDLRTMIRKCKGLLK